MGVGKQVNENRWGSGEDNSEKSFNFLRVIVRSQRLKLPTKTILDYYTLCKKSKLVIIITMKEPLYH